MKKLYLLSLICLLGSVLNAQPDQLYRTKSDSTPVYSPQSVNRAGLDRNDSLQHPASDKSASRPGIRTFVSIQLPEVVPAQSRVQTALLPIHKGDSLKVDLSTRYDLGRRFKTTLRQSLEAATLTYLTSQRVAVTQLPETDPAATQRNRPSVGIGILLPLAQLLRIDRKPDAWLQCDLYTQDSVLLKTVKEPLSRSARKHWFVSTLVANAPENGFFRISYVNRGRRPIGLSGLSLESTAAEDTTRSVESSADSPATDSLAAPADKPGSIADEFDLQSTGECQPNPYCTVCNNYSSCWDPCQCEPRSCTPEYECSVCNQGTACYDACKCNGGGPGCAGDCESNPYDCACNPAYCNPCETNPNSCECNPSNCTGPNPCDSNPNTCECNPAYCGSGGPSDPTGGSGPLPEPMRTATFSSKENGCNTFRSMWNRQNNDRHVEQAAFITDRGVFWLSDAGNHEFDFWPGNADDYGGPVGGKYFVKDGVTYHIKAIVHTHPLGDSPRHAYGVSDRDLTIARNFGVPIYSIADEGIGKGSATGTNQGIINHNTNLAFDCDLDQNMFEELR